MSGKRYLGPARIELKGNQAYASRYIPRGRVLLQRALDALAPNDALRASTVREHQADGAHIEASALASGLTIRIDVSSILPDDCCTWNNAMPVDPNQEEEELEEDEMFGSPTWEGLSCGDELEGAYGWYNEGSQPSVHLEEFFSEYTCTQPCPKTPENGRIGFFGVAVGHCNAVSRSWDLVKTDEEGGNTYRVFMTACVDKRTKKPVPLFLDVYVNVAETKSVYDWKQYQRVHDGMGDSEPHGQTGGNDCTDSWGNVSLTPVYFSQKWWETERVEYHRQAELRIELILGSKTIPVFDLTIFRDWKTDRVETTLKVDNRPLAEVDHCGTSTCCCPNSYSIPTVSSSGWEDDYNIFSDVTTVHSTTVKSINKCPSEDTEGEEVDDGVYQQISPNGQCARCVIYQNDEIVCTGPWVSRATGDPCSDPGVEDDPEEDEDPVDWLTDETGEEDGPEVDPIPPSSTSPIDTPIDQLGLGWPDNPSWFSEPKTLSPLGSDEARGYQATAQSNTPDAGKIEIVGTLPPDRFLPWMFQLMKLPIKDFAPDNTVSPPTPGWRPPSMIYNITDGHKCPNQDA